MHEDDDEYYDYKNLDPWLEASDVEESRPYSAQTASTGKATSFSAKSRPSMIGGGSPAYAATGPAGYQSKSWMTESIVKKIQDAVSAVMEPVFQQIMDRLDEIEERLAEKRDAA